MYIKLRKDQFNGQYFDPETERCLGCDGHWKCFCEDEWTLQLVESEMRIIRAILMREHLKLFEPKENKFIIKFLEQSRKQLLGNEDG